MTRLLGLASLLAASYVVAAGPAASAPGPRCGGSLWRLMTLSDPGRAAVDLGSQSASIAAIAKLRPLARTPASRSTRFQRHAWRMRTVIDRYRIASNGEIVLTLYSIDSAQYMNAYLESPHCLGRLARDRAGMISARRHLTARCPPVKWSWELLGITVDIAGVGFWNPSRATRGALANGAELRPVTSLRIVTGCGVG